MMAPFGQIAEVVVRRWSSFVAVLAVTWLAGAGVALADTPFRADLALTDRAGVLDAAGSRQVTEAIAALDAEDGTDLYVVFVESFDGADPAEWAEEAARLSQLGTDDVLFAVATRDRAYDISYDTGFRLSQSVTDGIAADDVEPRLGADDWAGAAVALADGLRTGGSGGGGGVPLGVLIAGGVAAAGGGAYLLSRRRRREADPVTTAPEPVARDEFTDVPTDDLAYRASSALIEVDDAVRTSEQELGAARAHFGDEAVAGFVTAVELSRADMLRAFEIRQRLDDDRPEDEPTRRGMCGDIIRACLAADERLDAQVDAFDRLRDLEATAPEFIAGLATRLDVVAARVPPAEAAWKALRGRYAVTALEPVGGHLDQAHRLLDVAGAEVAEARADLTNGSAAGTVAKGGSAAAVVSGRAAEDAMSQAETLLDGIPRREAELADAASRVAASRAEVTQDVAEARALAGDLAPLVARAEAAISAADQAAGAALPDPLAALRLLDEAGTALDGGLDQARAAQDRA
ncbi:MAG: TPM domain-containing protein, partial [Pseudonocardia sp.]|nr:TPM domain-containing protein [Pseudonocardia sp.]